MRITLVLLCVFVSVVHAQADVRVQVTDLKGEPFTGIARGGVTVEVSRRGQFTKGDDKKAKGAGIRLWYWRDLDGYVFLEYSRIKSTSILGELSVEESAALLKAMTVTRTPASRPTRVTESVPVPESRPAEPTPDPADAAILKEFPIDEGWNPERFGEIQRRRIVLHINPTKKEQEFVDRFDEFRTAYDKAEAAKPSKPAISSPLRE